MSRSEPGRNLSSKSPSSRQPGSNTTERSSSRERQDVAAAAAATAAAAGVEGTRSSGAQLPSLASLSAPAAHQQGQLSSLLNIAGSSHGQEGRRKTPPASSDESGSPPGLRQRQSLPELRQDTLGTSHAPTSALSQYQRPAGIESDRYPSVAPTGRYSLPPTTEAYRSPPSSYVVRTSPKPAEHGMGPPQPPLAAATAPEAPATTAARPEPSPYGTQAQQYAPLLPPTSSGPSQRQHPAFDPRFRFPSSQSHSSQGLTSPTSARYAAISSGEASRHPATHEREAGHRFGDSSSQGSILISETGPLSFPIDHQAASRVADEKRRRNAGASARFRARRKEKEQQNTREIDDLKQKIRDLEEDSEFYRRERDYFASILINSAERDRYFPRPASPWRLRVNRPPAEEGYVSYEEHGQRGGDDRTGRRRLTGEYSQSQGQDPSRGPLPPPPPPQPGAAPHPPHVPGQPSHQYQQAGQHRHYASAPPYGPPPPYQGPLNYSQAPSYAPPPQSFYGSEARRAPAAPSDQRPTLPPASTQPYGAPPPPLPTTSQQTSTPSQSQQHSQPLSQQQAHPSHSSSASWAAPSTQRPP